MSKKKKAAFINAVTAPPADRGESVPYTVTQIQADVLRLSAVVQTFQMLTHANEDEISLMTLQPIADDGYDALASLLELSTALVQGAAKTGNRITLALDHEPPEAPDELQGGAQ